MEVLDMRMNFIIVIDNKFKQISVHTNIQMYKFLIKGSDYTCYEYVETKTFHLIKNIPKTPLELKLFSNDVFNFDFEKNVHTLIHSNFKSNNLIPGILDLTMTHGKEGKKLLYLCKPDDKRIPFFLIPYNIPASFDKSTKKLYITFEFKHWNHTRPHGTMTQNLGSIDILNNFYEYILYCKSLNVSIQQFTKEARHKIQNQTNDMVIESISKKYALEERTSKDYYIFTIDAPNSNDYDDAISYDFKEHKISIYITNVALVLDYLQLWDAFSNRVSTIYLPDKKRTMLPSMLVDCLCSLKQKEYKLCYVLDIYYDKYNSIKHQKLGLCKAYIKKNLEYEKEYKENPHIQKIVEILRIQNKHKIITRLMLHFNHYITETFSSHKVGIFKSLYQKKEPNNKNIPEHIYNHLCILKSKASAYCLYQDNLKYNSITHTNMDKYLQITSPIRRLVDLLNNIVLMDIIYPNIISKNGKEFYKSWTNPESLDFINVSYRTIRKIQSKCHIYQQYMNNQTRGLSPYYDGFVFDKLQKIGDCKYQYMVYISELNLTTYVSLLQNLENYSNHRFSLHVFMNEENDKKKIKLQLCYEESFAAE